MLFEADGFPLGPAIAALEFQRSEIYTSVEDGRSWLVDPLLRSTQIVKFSGTDTAGSNNMLSGKTCDALAHFSLDQSQGHLVFVDIPGMPFDSLFPGFAYIDCTPPRHLHQAV